MRISILDTLILILRLIVVISPATAFGLSGTSTWVGEKIPFSIADYEILGAILAALAMLVMMILKSKSSAYSRSAAPAAFGTLLHFPAILSASSANWSDVMPSQMSSMFTDKGTSESVLLATFLALITSSALTFILDSLKEETADLEERGVDLLTIRMVSRQALLLKIVTLMIGLLGAGTVFIIGSVFGLPVGELADSIPVALVALIGVVAIVIPVTLFFNNRSPSAGNVGPD